MSYILEALQKAQAERQLGNAPTIHAPAPQYAPAPAGSRKAVLVGLGAGAAVVALGALWLLRQGAPAPAPVLQVAGAPASAVVTAPVAAPTPAQVAPVAPARPAPPPKPEPERKPAPKPEPKPAPEPEIKPEPRPSAPRMEPAGVAPAAPPHTIATAAAGADDLPGLLQSLPEAIQREVPKVVLGGYIYSPNPAERLLLVDKMLRREGEEIAPGLVLERLLPKAAIMNYRGYRYRVGY